MTPNATFDLILTATIGILLLAIWLFIGKLILHNQRIEHEIEITNLKNKLKNGKL